MPARYREIADHLRSKVATGRPGDRLPSDAELCSLFAVSRMTARQAVQVLVGEGLVERRRGAGTFIAARRVPRLLGSPLSFSESMRRRGMRASSRLLRRGTVTPTDDERKALGLHGDENAYQLERLRLADGTPMAIERVVMPAAIASTLPAGIEEGSLHEAFENAGHVPTRALAEVKAQRSTKRQRDLLELEGTDAVVLCERRTIWDQNGVPLERTHSCYAADRYSFEALMYRGQDGAV